MIDKRFVFYSSGSTGRRPAGRTAYGVDPYGDVAIAPLHDLSAPAPTLYLKGMSRRAGGTIPEHETGPTGNVENIARSPRSRP
jgi:hypothetical protein